MHLTTEEFTVLRLAVEYCDRNRNPALLCRITHLEAASNLPYMRIKEAMEGLHFKGLACLAVSRNTVAIGVAKLGRSHLKALAKTDLAKV